MSDIYKRALEDGKCVTTAHWLNDVVIGKEYMMPHNPLHIPTQFKTGKKKRIWLRIFDVFLRITRRLGNTVFQMITTLVNINLFSRY